MTDLRYSPEELDQVLQENPHISVFDCPVPVKANIPRSEAKVPCTCPSICPESEADFQKRVIKLLQENGWLVHAERAARSQKGWMTPIQGDAGWPDVIAVHKEKHLLWIIECKSDKGKLSEGQEKWLMAMARCPGVDLVLILRPSEFDKLQEKIEEERMT